ncbi:MAG: NAD+ synthase [Chloroflexi bacterium]|nr:NAD+ synthase [Chloroflexota bacterium]
MRPLRLALAQMNATVGDLQGNADHIIEFAEQAKRLQADIVAFPELAITGYPPEDLLLKRQFLTEAEEQLNRIAAATNGIVVVVGTPHLVNGNVFNPARARTPDAMTGKLYNAAAVVSDGEVIALYHKIFLPNYGVFDEARYFEPGNGCPLFQINGVTVGLNVCEDIWYEEGPATIQRAAGAEVILNINASPYHRSKSEQRQTMLSKRARDHGAFIAYLNTVGGQDELVFDGQSVVFGPQGELVARAPQFEEHLLVVDLDADLVGPPTMDHKDIARLGATIGKPTRLAVTSARVRPRAPIHPTITDALHPLTEVYQALVTGTRDYVRKSGFPGAVIGLSGGIDSALTVAIAVDALGAENVTAFFMPSQYTADQSHDDSVKLTQNMGVRLEVLPIKPIFDQFLNDLAPLFEGRQPDTTEENLQARIRGNLLMAASNKFGWIVLTTGNKSEMATGYATLYGDMAGGFAVIKDVPKTLVQQLSWHRNVMAGREVIPESIIVRPPTAELRPDQKDEDSLPPYDVLDPILKAYVEDDLPVEEMLAAGMPPEAVEQTMRLVDRTEYKRRQAPPGVKITERNFGRDRRLPLVNKYRPTSRR